VAQQRERYGAAVADEVVHDGRSVCGFCQEPVPEVGWIGLEVTREGVLATGQRGDLEFLDVVFCRQEHAASFLTQPLPPLQPQAPPPPRSPARERLELTAVIAGGVVTLGLIGIGVWTVVQWFVAG
jgi:hypothetical protein